MREVKTLIVFGLVVLIGMSGLSLARVVDDDPHLQARLKSALNIDSFYFTVK